MVDIFTTKAFESVLRNANYTFHRLGLVQGEYAYAIYVRTGVNQKRAQFRIVVRSSVKSSGVSAGTGKDSIRLYIESAADGKHWKPVGKGADAYTTRVSGWEGRLVVKLAEIERKILRVRQDLKGQDVVRFAKTPANMGRPFAIDGNTDRFDRWLDF